MRERRVYVRDNNGILTQFYTTGIVATSTTVGFTGGRRVALCEAAVERDRGDGTDPSILPSGEDIDEMIHYDCARYKGQSYRCYRTVHGECSKR